MLAKGERNLCFVLASPPPMGDRCVETPSSAVMRARRTIVCAREREREMGGGSFQSPHRVTPLSLAIFTDTDDLPCHP